MQKAGRTIAVVLKTHIRACVVALCLIISGVLIGNIVARFIEEDKLSEIYDTVSWFYEGGQSIETDKLTLFFKSLKEYTFSFIFILVCSFSVWFIPVALGRLIYEGFCMGVSSGILVRLFGLKAFLHTGIWLIFKNFLFVPFLVASVVYSVQKAIMRRKRKIQDNKKILIEIMVEILCVLGVSVLCSLMESFVASELIHKLI